MNLSVFTLLTRQFFSSYFRLSFRISAVQVCDDESFCVGGFQAIELNLKLITIDEGLIGQSFAPIMNVDCAQSIEVRHILVWIHCKYEYYYNFFFYTTIYLNAFLMTRRMFK